MLEIIQQASKKYSLDEVLLYSNIFLWVSLLLLYFIGFAIASGAVFISMVIVGIILSIIGLYSSDEKLVGISTVINITVWTMVSGMTFSFAFPEGFIGALSGVVSGVILVCLIFVVVMSIVSFNEYIDRNWPKE